MRFFHWDKFDKTAMCAADFGRKTILERKPGSASATPRTVHPIAFGVCLKGDTSQYFRVPANYWGHKKELKR